MNPKHQEILKTEDSSVGPSPLINPSKSGCGQARPSRNNTSAILEISSDPGEKPHNEEMGAAIFIQILCPV
ncbi:hypothetical protein TNCV_1651021, partial [Trichonephila clavipes]